MVYAGSSSNTLYDLTGFYSRIVDVQFNEEVEVKEHSKNNLESFAVMVLRVIELVTR